MPPTGSATANQYEAACPDGKRVLGGGVKSTSSDSVVFGSSPSNALGSGWFGELFNPPSPNSVTMTVYAICANVQ